MDLHVDQRFNAVDPLPRSLKREAGEAMPPKGKASPQEKKAKARARRQNPDRKAHENELQRLRIDGVGPICGAGRARFRKRKMRMTWWRGIISRDSKRRDTWRKKRTNMRRKWGNMSRMMGNVYVAYCS
eukprot:4643385-Pyramimonas_sp.AAC.1